jgi:hypothetical protein
VGFDLGHHWVFTRAFEIRVMRRYLPSQTVTVGNSPARVQFGEMTPAFEGRMQVNFVMLNLAPGDYAMQVTIGNATSNHRCLTFRSDGYRSKETWTHQRLKRLKVNDGIGIESQQ